MPDITAEELRRLLSYDAQTGLFRQNQTGKIIGSLVGRGYVRVKAGDCIYAAHRLAWLYVYGEWPKKELDHINRVKNDNRIANLREATRSENAQNVGAHKDNAAGVRGILWDKSRRKWVAELTLNGKLVFKQRFNTKEEAIAARKQAEEKHHAYRAC